MSDEPNLTRLSTLMEVMSSDLKDVKGDLKEIRRENETWRQAHEKAVQDKLDHARRNSEAKFDAIERKLAEKVSSRDLEANQAESDERFVEVKTMISEAKAHADTKAPGWVGQLVAGLVVLILTAVAGIWIKVAVIDPAHVQTGRIPTVSAPHDGG